jgi:hypothetical protein
VSGQNLVWLEEFRDVYVEGLGNALKNHDRWIALTYLNATQIGLMNVSPVRDVLLRHLLFTPDALQVSFFNYEYNASNKEIAMGT